MNRIEKTHPFESEKISRLMVRLAPPVMLAQLIQALYNIVDSYFIGRYSDEALTALSLIYPLQLLITALGVGTGVGVNTLISRYRGERQDEKAVGITKAGNVLGILNWLIFAVCAGAVMRGYLHISTDSSEVFGMALIYGNIVCIFSIGIFMESIWTKVLQADGNMKLPMAAQIVGALVNICLDPVLIFGMGRIPAFGVAGAAVATVIGQVCAAVIVGTKGFWGFTGFRNVRKYMGRIYRAAFPSIVMQSLYTVYIVGLNLILAGFSDDAVTVLGLYYKVQTFFFIPLMGLQNCIVPVLSYNHAAKQNGRCREVMRFAVLFGGFTMCIATAVYCGIPGLILGIFTKSRNVLEIGVPAFRIIAGSFIPSVLGWMIPVYFQAIGYGKESLFLIILRQIILLVPLAYVFSKFGLGYVWLTFPASEVITAVFGAVIYLRHLKKRKIL